MQYLIEGHTSFYKLFTASYEEIKKTEYEMWEIKVKFYDEVYDLRSSITECLFGYKPYGTM